MLLPISQLKNIASYRRLAVHQSVGFRRPDLHGLATSKRNYLLKHLRPTGDGIRAYHHRIPALAAGRPLGVNLLRTRPLQPQPKYEAQQPSPTFPILHSIRRKKDSFRIEILPDTCGPYLLGLADATLVSCSR